MERLQGPSTVPHSTPSSSGAVAPGRFIHIAPPASPFEELQMQEVSEILQSLEQFDAVVCAILHELEERLAA